MEPTEQELYRAYAEYYADPEYRAVQDMIAQELWALARETWPE